MFGHSRNVKRVRRSACLMVCSGLMLFSMYCINCDSGKQPMPLFMVDEIGRQQAESLENVVLSGTNANLSQFADSRTYGIAEQIYNEMQTSDSGVLENYEFKSIADLKKVIQCLGYEILAGETSPVLVYAKGDSYVIGWSDAEEVLKQNEIAENYIDEIYKENKYKIDALSSEKEKADYIADLITDKIISSYDWNYEVRTIYDLVNSPEKKGVCTVYTTLFDRLCERAGIECYVEIGVSKTDESAFHCWNKVIFEDGSTHYYDLTSFASSWNKNFKDMSLEYYNNNFTYRKLTNLEFGYKAGVNYVK